MAAIQTWAVIQIFPLIVQSWSSAMKIKGLPKNLVEHFQSIFAVVTIAVKRCHDNRLQPCTRSHHFRRYSEENLILRKYFVHSKVRRLPWDHQELKPVKFVWISALVLANIFENFGRLRTVCMAFFLGRKSFLLKQSCMMNNHTNEEIRATVVTIADLLTPRHCYSDFEMFLR